MLWYCCYSVKYKQYVTNKMTNAYQRLLWTLYAYLFTLPLVESNIFSDISTFSWNEKPKQLSMNGTRYLWWTRNYNFTGMLPFSLPLPFTSLLPSFDPCPSPIPFLLLPSYPLPFPPVPSPSLPPFVGLCCRFCVRIPGRMFEMNFSDRQEGSMMLYVLSNYQAITECCMLVGCL